MNLYKYLFFILTLTVLIFSCKQESKVEEKIEAIENAPQDLKNVEVAISGMTCEIGCAKLIQSKLYKTEGITFADISFEKAQGKITFDSNRLNDQELKEIIERIAGGDLYRVEEMNVVSVFPPEGDNEEL